jgi:hypothetical protein
MIVAATNILINNSPFEALQKPVRITDSRPTVGWVYQAVPRVQINDTEIESLSVEPQAAFEIRIGNSANLLGTNAYSGTEIDTGLITSDATSWQLRETDLNRGETYFGQIRVEDGLGNTSPWTTFSFKFNSLPQIGNLFIEPQSPSLHDELTVSYQFSDIDDDIENGSDIYWFCNGVRQRQLDGLTIVDSSYLAYGDAWTVEVTVNDGYEFGESATSSPVAVATPTPVASQATILPSNPSTGDPLYAQYLFNSSSGTDQSIINWYVNGELVVENATAFIRLSANVGDSVHFEIQPNDGVSDGSFLASSPVVLSAPPYEIFGLRIDNQSNPLLVKSFTPKISWENRGSQNPSIAIINIGTAPQTSNIGTFVTNGNEFNVPVGLLSAGSDYFVSVSVGDSGNMSDYAVIKFRTPGSRWKELVSNAIGWTIETNLYVSGGLSGIEYGDTAQYHGIQISDGTYAAEIRIYVDEIKLVSGTASKTADADFTTNSILTIIGSSSNIKVFQNYKLIIDGTGLFIQQSSSPSLAFGSLYGGMDGYYQNFYYTTTGAFDPTASNNYNNFAFTNYYETNGEIDYVTAANGLLYFSTSDSGSSDVYAANDGVATTEAIAFSKTFVNVYRIVSNGNFAYVCHDSGTTVFSGYEVPNYDSQLIPSTPDGTWTAIDKAEGSEYSQYTFGTPWFDRVQHGSWTLEFEVDVHTNNGVGIYINDGIARETIVFFQTQIVFKEAGVVVKFDTTDSYAYSLLCKGDQLKLFAAGNEIASAPFTTMATTEGNGGRPRLCESNGVRHATYHDDGSGHHQIYYTEEGGTGWSTPIQIAGATFASSNPDVVADSIGNVFVAFESGRADTTNIGIVVRNQFGWGQPYEIRTASNASKSPRLAADAAGNIHCVWEDYQDVVPQIYWAKRDATSGSWTVPVAITSAPFGGFSPSVVANGSSVFVAYSQSKSNGFSDIYATAFNGLWNDPVAVYMNGRDASAADLTTDADTLYIVWHDSASNGNYQIYARRMDHNLVAYESVKQLTIEVDASRFPSIGLAANGNAYVVWESGGDISPYVDRGDYVATTPIIHCAYFNSGMGHWLSDSQTFSTGGTVHGGYDTVFYAPDLRAMMRPTIAKYFATTAHCLYESLYASSNESVVTPSESFVGIRDAVYDLSANSSFMLDATNDTQASGQLARKEVRFSDYSEFVSPSYSLSYLRYYLGGAVEPDAIQLLSSQNAAMTSSVCTDATINVNGDGWIANEGGLLFFFRKDAGLAAVGQFSGTVQSVAFDKNNVLFVGTSSNLYTSADHTAFEVITLPTTITAMPSYQSIAFDSQNNLWAATDQGILNLITSEVLSFSTSPILVTSGSFVSTVAATRVVIDANDTVWAATSQGLISIQSGVVTIYNTSNSSIPSNTVNDIGIRTTGVRYIATDSGLAKMTGDFENIIITDPNWSDRVTACCWQTPNILWASCASSLFRLFVDDDANTYLPQRYSSAAFALISPGECDQPRVYHFDGFNSSVLMEVYVNGRKVNKGFVFSQTDSAVIFDSPLLPTDLVQINVRSDITPFSTLTQNAAEVLINGELNRRITKMASDGDSLYVQIDGDNSLVAICDAIDQFMLPYATVGLDTVPPTGTLTFVRQISSRLIELQISASDDFSGVIGMIVSNFQNLTSDGVTPLTYVPFQSDISFDVGINLTNKTEQITFSDTIGNRLLQYNNVLYAGTTSPARIYSYDALQSWSLVVTLDAASTTAGIQFLTIYNGAMIVGTGDPNGSGKVYTSLDGKNFTLLAAVTGTAATCAVQLKNDLYIGTAGQGLLYYYDGTNLNTIDTSNTSSANLLQFGTDILSLATDGAVVYAGTDAARIYSFDPKNLFSLIVYLEPNENPISSLASASFSALTGTATIGGSGSTYNFLFGGTAESGTIIKTINSGPFTTSFNGQPTPVNMIKTCNGNIYAAVGNTLYYYDFSWIARLTHTDIIQDFFVGPYVANVTDPNATVPPPADLPPNADFYIIDSGGITKYAAQTEKTVYLSLIDAAGNTALILPGTDLGSVTDFTNSDAIIELDEYGTAVFRYDGDGSFYSADRVLVEQGVYLSEVFDGTDDHVTWDIVYWDADVPDGTNITISIRTGDDRTTLPTLAFQKVLTEDQFTGADISNLSGQFIQFQVNLSTTIRGKSPKLYKLVIRSKSRATAHFFTTNFTLPSRILGGIVTADIYLPISADVIIGIDTNDSTNFPDYQEVSPDQVFTTDASQMGSNLRIGVKLISPLPVSTATDPISDYGPYSEPLYTNVVVFNYTNSTADSQTVNFQMTFYNDELMTDLQSTLYTLSNQSFWSADHTAFPTAGASVAAGETIEVIVAVAGNAAIRCGIDYFFSLKSTLDGLAFSPVIEAATFVSTCNPQFFDDLSFDFTNENENSTFQFRVQVYADAQQTTLLKSYYSGLDSTDWLVNGTPIPFGGAQIPQGETVVLQYTPDSSSLTAETTYYLSIDYIDLSQTEFTLISAANQMRFTQPTDFVCSEYVNVPVVRDIGIMFDLDDYTDAFGNVKHTVMLNI